MKPLIFTNFFFYAIAVLFVSGCIAPSVFKWTNWANQKSDWGDASPFDLFFAFLKCVAIGLLITLPILFTSFYEKNFIHGAMIIRTILPIITLFFTTLILGILADVSITHLFLENKDTPEAAMKNGFKKRLWLIANRIRYKKNRRLSKLYLKGKAFQKLVYTYFCGGLVAMITTLTVLLSVYGIGDYGSFLFIGSPFLAGLLSVGLYGLRYTPNVKQILLLSLIPLGLAGVILLLSAIEGFICLMMALPLAGILGIIGGFMGYTIIYSFRPAEKEKPKRKNRNKFYAVALALPLLLLFEKQPLFVQPISTSLIINAPPSAVWPYVIAFPKLPEPTSWWFHAGIAHPKGAVIKGTGVGAVRYCNFTTGPFVEPITAWEPPHRLAFDVAKQPPSMKEMSPWPNIHPPHLGGYFQSKRGEFRLIPLANGGTKVVGTTWYVMNIWPHAYWHLWSDMLLHAIHYEVLNHIKTQVESHKSTPSPTPKS